MRQKEVDALFGIVTSIVDEIDRPGRVMGDEPVAHDVDEGGIVSKPVTVTATVDGPLRDEDPFLVRLVEGSKPVENLAIGAGAVEHLFRLTDGRGVVGIAGREDDAV